MRKRLGILLLIFSLFLFFPTQKAYGQSSWGNQYTLPPPEAVIIGLLLILPFWAIDYFLSEDKKCDSFWHPGDYYYEKNYKFIKPMEMKLMECYNNCTKKSMDMNVAMGSLRSNKGLSHNQCYNPCAIDAYKLLPSSIPTCKYEGIKGHYSDGSYCHSSGYSSNLYIVLKNRHKLKDKYEKTEWQKARDECMELTSKKRIKFLEGLGSYQERLFGFYNDCLKERGY